MERTCCECQEQTNEQSAWLQNYPMIAAISSPADVQALPEREIPALCDELRHFLIEQTQQHGGHLASNLGVVELTVAIHRIFHVPVDHVIFDVGHQCYVHKVLTGRAEKFSVLREFGGLSGFPKRDECDFDAFGTGHASTSLSAALGMAQADRLSKKDAYTVVVLGDGALTGGMIHEALNNCERDLRLIVIVNENEMSISKNIGHFATNLSHLRAAPGYLKTKTALERVLDRLPLLGKSLKRALSAMKRCAKNILYGNNYFESMGLSYFGPADGNNERTVEKLLLAAKERGHSCLIHLKTVKGKGYDPAQQRPEVYHSLRPSCACSGKPSFSATLGDELTALAKEHPSLCAITAAMRQGTGLSPFAAAYPSRFFDVGIAEEHAVTFAAGLAAGGAVPVVAIYSSFLQRSYDQVVHDVGLQRLPVVFCIDRAGLNPSDGATHYGVFDVPFLSTVAYMELFEPASTASMRRILRRCVEQQPQHPMAIRYADGCENDTVCAHFFGKSDAGCVEVFDGGIADFDAQSPPPVVIISYGRVCARAIEAAARRDGQVGILLLERLLPLDHCVSFLQQLLRHGVTHLIFLEEGIKTGGVGQQLVERLMPTATRMDVLAISPSFVCENGSLGDDILNAAGLSVERLLQLIDQKDV